MARVPLHGPHWDALHFPRSENIHIVSLGPRGICQNVDAPQDVENLNRFLNRHRQPCKNSSSHYRGQDEEFYSVHLGSGLGVICPSTRSGTRERACPPPGLVYPINVNPGPSTDHDNCQCDVYCNPDSRCASDRDLLHHDTLGRRHSHGGSPGELYTIRVFCRDPRGHHDCSGSNGLTRRHAQASGPTSIRHALHFDADRHATQAPVHNGATHPHCLCCCNHHADRHTDTDLDPVCNNGILLAHGRYYGDGTVHPDFVSFHGHGGVHDCLRWQACQSIPTAACQASAIS
jgi:hypothetical protein